MARPWLAPPALQSRDTPQRAPLRPARCVKLAKRRNCALQLSNEMVAGVIRFRVLCHAAAFVGYRGLPGGSRAGRRRGTASPRAGRRAPREGRDEGGERALFGEPY